MWILPRSTALEKSERAEALSDRPDFTELKPQETGTGLLIRFGEVATTSGSTNSLPGRLIVGQRPLKARMLVRFQPRQPVLASRASTRPVVK